MRTIAGAPAGQDGIDVLVGGRGLSSLSQVVQCVHSGWAGPAGQRRENVMTAPNENAPEAMRNADEADDTEGHMKTR